MTRGLDAKPSSVRPVARGVLSGAALLVMICGAAVAQVEQAERDFADQPKVDLIGSPKNPEPVFNVAPDEKLSDTTLYLAVGRVDTSARKTAASFAQAIADAGADDHMVIQLDGPLDERRKGALAEAGLDLLGYLPTNAFIVRPSGADVQKAANLDFVVWHSDFETAWKINPEIGTRQYATPERQAIDDQGRIVLNTILFADADFDTTLRSLIVAFPSLEHHLTQHLGDETVFNVTVDKADVPMLAEFPEIQFIEEAPEVTPRNATTTWIVQSNVNNQTPIHDHGLHGEGQIVGISDGRVDVDHCAFADTAPIGPSHRKIEAYNTAISGFDFHGTHVAGTAVGDNGAAGDNRGIAYAGRFVFDDTPSFSDTAVYNMLQTHHNQGARVHTNSWGNDGTTQYDGLSRGIDRFSYDFEDSLVLFAVTNGSLLRNPENAKNALAVGASQDASIQGNHCSGGDGPTSDGRRKPEIYAPGCGTMSASVNTACSIRSLTGTSMACPAVAGCAMLVREYYENGFYPAGIETPGAGLSPTGALVKATLLNATVDMTGVPGYPSNREGWGRVLLDNALFFQGDARTMFVEDIRNAEGMATGEITSYSITVTGDGEPLNITVAWTEPPATAGASAATINDLDLRVVSPAGVEYKGNVFAGGQSVTGGTFDDKNNVETVRIDTPQVGEWTVEVIASSINQGTQGFAVAANGSVNQGPIPLSASLNSILPDTLDRLETFEIELEVFPGDDTLVSDSVQAFVAPDGSTFTPMTLTEGPANIFKGTIGPFECEDTPRVYLRAEGEQAGERFVAGASITNPHEIAIGATVIAAEDDFEANTGWTVASTATTGQWQRATPQPTAAQPGLDTTPDGVACFITGAAAGTSLGSFDVDGGSTTLTSPIFDLSGLVSATVTYNRWYSNDTGGAPNADTFVVEVSNNDGATWLPIEVVGPAGAGTSGGWIEASYTVENVVALTNQVRFRFTASDLGTGSIIEAGVDDFKISDFVCNDQPINVCVADFNNDGSVNLGDFGIFAAAFGSTPADSNWDPRADFDNNGQVDLGDFGIFGTEFNRMDCFVE